MRYSLQVQYIGKNYAGSQIQFENGKEIEIPTIQGELEKALSTLISGDTANINRQFKTIFSGRTDSGVNAEGQVIHFDVNEPIVASKFVYQLNEILPDDISVSDLKQVDEKFFIVGFRLFVLHVNLSGNCLEAVGNGGCSF